MPDELENHTLRLLKEMREEIGQIRDDNRQLREEVQQGFADVNLRIDGLTHIMTILAGHIYQHEERITKLEQGSS